MGKRRDSAAKAHEIEIAERRQRALDLRRQGLSYQQIGAATGVTNATAWQDVHFMLKKLAERNEGRTKEWQALELDRLDDLERAARRVLTTNHVHVNNGRIIRDQQVNEETGEVTWTTLTDDGPVLQAVGALVRIAERRARLLGLDAPRKTELTGADGEPLVPVTTEDLAARFDQLVLEQAARLAK